MMRGQRNRRAAALIGEPIAAPASTERACRSGTRSLLRALCRSVALMGLVGCVETAGDVLSPRPPDLGVALAPPDLGPEGQGCTTSAAGGPQSCEDAMTWKSIAQVACEQRAQQVTLVVPYGECGASRFHAVAYRCCGAPVACVKNILGDVTSCKTSDQWKLIVDEDCRTRGLVLSIYQPTNDCDVNSFRQVIYQCCPP